MKLLKIFIGMFIILLCIAPPLKGQSLLLSLDQAKQYAMKNNKSLMNAKDEVV